MYNKILIPTDGSVNSERAARHALWIASKSKADILVLNVFEVYSPTLAVPLSSLPGSNEDMYEPLKKEGEGVALDLVKGLENFPEFNNVKIDIVVREGKPHQEILKTITEMDVDLVVIGASGRHGFDRIALGSVTERVMRQSKKPLLVVP
jgi:nucleotide-binding universal stress UspA family protein